MPNNCYNTITIDSIEEDVQKIHNHLKGSDTPFDFNQLVPMPEELKDILFIHAKGETIYYSRKKWKQSLNGSSKDVFDEMFPSTDWLFENRIDEKTIKDIVSNHGTASWYDWCISNWGTKWNAYEVEFYFQPTPPEAEKENGIENTRRLVYKFVTAWDKPEPIVEAFMRYLSQPGFDDSLTMKWTHEVEG